jgi:FixJ family two-component response regulator
MIPTTIFLIDENAQQRRAYALAISELLEGSEYTVQALPPLQSQSEYAGLIAKGSAAALIVDQKMEDGGIPYSGTELAAYLRSIAPKLPIVILSNYTEDTALFEKGEGAVEYVISKTVIGNPTSREAQLFKERFLRRLSGFTELLNARAQRHHDLLLRSLKDKLTPEEESELGLLEIDRALPQQANELGDIKALETAIEELKKRIASTDFPI